MLRTVPGTHSARIMRKPSLIITFIHSLLRSSWCSFEKISQLYFATGGLSCISTNCVVLQAEKEKSLLAAWLSGAARIQEGRRLFSLPQTHVQAWRCVLLLQTASPSNCPLEHLVLFLPKPRLPEPPLANLTTFHS